MAHIIYAGYGAGNRTVNASEAVAKAYAAGEREFYASNELAGDPAPGEGKTLFVVWAQDGVLASGVTAEEGEEAIRIP